MDKLEMEMIQVVNDHAAKIKQRRIQEAEEAEKRWRQEAEEAEKRRIRQARRQAENVRIYRSEAIQKAILWTLAAITALTAAGTLILSAIG